MRPRTPRDWIIALAKATPKERTRIIHSMSPIELLRLDAYFEAWAHSGQLPPEGEGWRVWLMMAGRGFGKTRAGAEWVHALTSAKRGLRIALVGATIHEARNIMVEGVSGLLRVARMNGEKLTWEPSLGKLRWRNGSEAQLFSGENPDGLRGPEHDFAWADELAKWAQPEAAWHNLQMGLRRGSRARALITTTPRPMRLLERIRDDKWTVMTSGRTDENINLDERYVEVMTATYGGTRLGRQELDGELIADVEGALWPRELIERSRAAMPEQFDRIVVGVDPPAGVGEGCDACGIVVAEGPRAGFTQSRTKAARG
jgi:phage terminase large subunit-like protein